MPTELRKQLELTWFKRLSSEKQRENCLLELLDGRGSKPDEHTKEYRSVQMDDNMKRSVRARTEIQSAYLSYRHPPRSPTVYTVQTGNNKTQVKRIRMG